MLEQYTANARALGWSTSESYVQDSQDLTRFSDGVFDAVVMNVGIFALEDAVAGIREMYRVLMSGGHAVVTTWKTRRPQQIMNRAAEAIHPRGDGNQIMDIDRQWTTGEHLVNIMVGGGFGQSNVRLSETAPDWRFDSLDALLGALSSPMWTSRFCKGWSEEEKARWTEEIAKQLTDEEKARCSLEMVAFVCVAQKVSDGFQADAVASSRGTSIVM
jgi:SAM-dependent methyltransferase